MIADFIVKLSLLMPRGGYLFLVICSKFFRRLRSYPVIMAVAPHIKLHANLDALAKTTHATWGMKSSA